MSDINKKRSYTAVNSIDNSVYVKRLHQDNYGFSTFSEMVINYGVDNLYPDKLRSVAQRSGSLSTALKTFKRFVRGQSFENDEIRVNQKGMTLRKAIDFSANDMGHFGVAIHINYNILGQKTEITPLSFEQVRIDYEGYPVVARDWSELYSGNWMDNNAPVRYNRYNPDPAVVRAEIIEAGGIENYKGQILYWHDSDKTYPLAMYDSVCEDGQLEADAKIYSLANIQNGFTAGGVLLYPASVESNEEARDQIHELRVNTTGNTNAGRVIAIPLNASGIESGFDARSMYNSFQQNNVDSLFKNQKEDAKRNIYEIFQQPSILNGRSDSGMFNQQSMQDAFDYYNSITQEYREDLEDIYNSLLDNSVFGVNNVSLEPIYFIQKQTDESETNVNEQEENDESINN